VRELNLTITTTIFQISIFGELMMVLK